MDESSIFVDEGALSHVHGPGLEQDTPLISFVHAGMFKDATVQDGAGLSQHLILGIPGYGLHSLVNGDNDPSLVHDHDPVLDGVHDLFPVVTQFPFKHGPLTVRS